MFFLFALACATEDSGVVLDEVALPAQRLDGVAHVASVRRAPMVLPPRYAAPLDPEVAEELLPPRDWYAHKVCRGGAQREDWWGAVGVSADHSRAEQLAWYAGWVHYCEDPEWCGWVRERLGDEATLPSARPLLQGQLSGCADARDLIGEASAEVVISWFELHPGGWDPALARAVEEVVSMGQVWPARRAALVMGGVVDPRADEQLVRLYRDAPTADLRDAVAVGLHSQISPSARQVFTDFCARPLEERDLLCDGGGTAWLRPEQRLAAVSPVGLGHAVRDFLVEPADLVHLAEADRPVASTALASCAASPVQLQSVEREYAAAVVASERCLAALALVDRGEAVRAAGQVLVAGGERTPLAARLVAWPDLEAAGSRLVELGLVGSEARPPWAVDPLDLVVGTGQGRWIDGEHWSYASLARDLAPLVGLEEVSFEEIAPLYDEAWMPVGEGLFWVHAYDGPWRYSAPARDWGDWLDHDQVVGLLNAVLEHRGSPERLVVTQGWEGSLAVVAGLGMSLEAAAAEGLIQVMEPEAPLEAGLGGALGELLR